MTVGPSHHWTFTWKRAFHFIVSKVCSQPLLGPDWHYLHCWWDGKLIQPPRRTVWRFLKKKKKLGIKLPHDPTIPLLGIYPEETIIERDASTPMFTAALFTVTRTWKQCRCPSTDEWIKKSWCIYNVTICFRHR